MRTKQERMLVAAVDTLNTELGKVLRRTLRADLDRTPWPLTADEEAVLALQAVQLAQQLLLHSRNSLQEAGAGTGLLTVKELPRSNSGRPS